MEAPTVQTETNPALEGILAEVAGRRPTTHLTQLVQSITEDTSIEFKTDGLTAFVKIREDLYPVDSPFFKELLAERYRTLSNDDELSQSAESNAVHRFATRALTRPPETVSVRQGFVDGVLWKDQGRGVTPRYVRIDRNGWTLEKDCPVSFFYPSHLLPLTQPSGSGDVGLLRKYLNVDETSWPLVLAWLVGTFHPFGPYQALVVRAEADSGKSSVARILRQLIDPSIGGQAAMFRENRDLLAVAQQSFLLDFENISKLSLEESDSLCRICTGGSLLSRTLHSNCGVTVMRATRPLMLNGIENFVTRGDLSRRCLSVELKTIPPEKRREQRHVDAEFKVDSPRILAGLYGLVSKSLAGYETVVTNVKTAKDFTGWVKASGAVADIESRVNECYGEQLSSLAQTSTLVQCLLSVFGDEGVDLRTEELFEKCRADPRWHKVYDPQTVRAFSGALTRELPALRQIGWNVNDRKVNGFRKIQFKKEVAA